MNNLPQRPMVLIVDDVPTNVQILAEALSASYRVKVASSAADALVIAQREPHPDLIMLDVMMPEIDGFEACRRLKENIHTKNIPVIFVTAKDAESDEEFGLKLGAVDYITKPFSIAVTKARVHNHIRLKQQADLLESLALVDSLTHIPNRRHFDQVLESEWKRAMRDAVPLSLIIVDIDYFKQYNDHYGHGAGDTCLQAVAEALSKAVVRPGDLVARYGGEEFVVILPDTVQEAALQVAERLRDTIEKLNLPHAYSEAAVVVTISVGVATQSSFSGDAMPEKLLDAADKALYMAKEHGRNRVYAND